MARPVAGSTVSTLVLRSRRPTGCRLAGDSRAAAIGALPRASSYPACGHHHVVLVAPAFGQVVTSTGDEVQPRRTGPGEDRGEVEHGLADPGHRGRRRSARRRLPAVTRSRSPAAQLTEPRQRSDAIAQRCRRGRRARSRRPHFEGPGRSGTTTRAHGVPGSAIAPERSTPPRAARGGAARSAEWSDPVGESRRRRLLGRPGGSCADLRVAVAGSVMSAGSTGRAIQARVGGRAIATRHGRPPPGAPSRAAIATMTALLRWGRCCVTAPVGEGSAGEQQCRGTGHQARRERWPTAGRRRRGRGLPAGAAGNAGRAECMPSIVCTASCRLPSSALPQA